MLDFEKIRNLFGEDKLEEVLNELLKSSTRYDTQLLTVKARLKKLNADVNGRLISYDQSEISRNSIRIQIATMIDQLKSENLDSIKEEREVEAPTEKITDYKSKKFSILVLYDEMDGQYCHEIMKHLFLLKRNKEIEFIDFNDVSDFIKSKKEVKLASIGRADLILFIISDNIFTGKNAEYALLVDENVGKKVIIPIRATKFDYSELKIADLAGLPAKGGTIKEASNEDSVLYDIAQDIKRVVKRLLGEK